MTQPTALERKHAARQALAILTVAVNDEDNLITDLIHEQGDMLPIVTASLAGMSKGLLLSFDDQHEGASACWLAWMGQRVEAMAESEEA